MNYELNLEQEKRFEEFYNKYKNKIKLAVIKCNINSNNFDHFYSHAVEGFLQSFLIMEAGDIQEKDFPAFAYTNMKRKVIDELRRMARNKDICVDLEENYSNLAYRDDKLDKFILNASIQRGLNSKEKRSYYYLEKGYTYKQIQSLENISKSTYYNIVSTIKNKCENLLYK